ncbi:bifunctional riboflavin kinase/FAD synthetase [Aliikangiella marina]|uniref:Riboflavin biosynthesis protein n=1 Tax=Aliikangiella marina TaxID=1712262 RepID=A0A545THW7_9GAMM|nr:bifunctional riboflavin kinase/FAD synthetase [Aliikangiella marina]TQV76824.1 bifunctional riboflavin kinase/FAD synthetase [Aliikangiella marina]
MKLIRGLVNLQHQNESSVATIGNFDGVHVGHQAIIEKVLAKAKQLGLPSCVLLFEPHPKEYFMGESCPPRLTCFREKYNALKDLGVDKLVVLQFNQSLRNMEAIAFVQSILIERLSIKHLVVGDDFHFGKQRKGNFQLLEQMSVGQYTLEPTPSVLVDGERVSSTLIRKTLAQADLAKAKKLLNRAFTISGKVGFGQQLGRTINFPTANVAIKRIKAPLNGVFLVKCRWTALGENCSAWGAANCGSRPTVDGTLHRLEVHLLDANPDLYGIELMVEFIASIRAEKKFDSVEALKRQIVRDVEVSRKLISQFETIE